MSERTKVTAKKSETEKGNSAAYKRKSELSQSKNSGPVFTRAQYSFSYDS